VGKPYSSELAQLGDTYRWALTADLNGLDRAISHVAPHCLLAVGSGGSLSVAEFAVGLHEIFSGRMAKTATPMAIGASPLPMFDLALLFLSAGGRNPDILGAFQRALLREPRHVCVLTGTPGSQLALRAADFEWVNTVAYQFPFGNDG